MNVGSVTRLFAMCVQDQGGKIVKVLARTGTKCLTQENVERYVQRKNFGEKVITHAERFAILLV